MTDKAIETVTGTGVVVRGNDIDTDRIIPARYMKVVTFDGLGEYAFRDVRFDEEGRKLIHPFNDPQRSGASILLVNKNFGCGSSREHAPQALMRWGIKAIVGESFAEIFAGNCNTLGIPAVCAAEDVVSDLMSAVEANSTLALTIDLPGKQVLAGDTAYPVTMPEAFRQALMSGQWDSTAELLVNRNAIHRVAESLPYVSGFGSR